MLDDFAGVPLTGSFDLSEDPAVRAFIDERATDPSLDPAEQLKVLEDAPPELVRKKK